MMVMEAYKDEKLEFVPVQNIYEKLRLGYDFVKTNKGYYMQCGNNAIFILMKISLREYNEMFGSLESDVKPKSNVNQIIQLDPNWGKVSADFLSEYGSLDDA